jgi:peptide/nickel transport system permease protein
MLSAVRGVPKVPFAILIAFVFLGVFGAVVAPHSPIEQSLGVRLRPPVWQQGGSWTYILGTDTLGRDVFSRVLVGARTALLIGLTAVCVAGAIGTMVGILSAYFGGAVDYILMRLTDAMMALPFLVVALAMAVVFTPSISVLIEILVLFGWAGYARVIRSSTLQLRNTEFVMLARVAGCSHVRIIGRHILPNVANTLVVLATLQLAVVIVAEASLSFLGVGVPPPTPDWGAMLSDGRQYVASAWWLAVAPGVCITAVVLSVNVLGDWLRIRLDPRLGAL